MTVPPTPDGAAEDEFEAAFNDTQLIMVDGLARDLGLTRNAATFHAVAYAKTVFDGLGERRFVLRDSGRERVRDLDPAVLFSKRAEQNRRSELKDRGVAVGAPGRWTKFWIRLTPEVKSSEFWGRDPENAPVVAAWLASEVVTATGAPDHRWEPGYLSQAGGDFEEARYDLPRGMAEEEALNLMADTLLWFDERGESDDPWQAIYDIFSSRHVAPERKFKFYTELHRMNLSTKGRIERAIRVCCFDANDMGVPFDQNTLSAHLKPAQPRGE